MLKTLRGWFVSLNLSTFFQSLCTIVERETAWDDFLDRVYLSPLTIQARMLYFGGAEKNLQTSRLF